MRRTAFLGGLLSLVRVGGVDAQAQPSPVVSESAKVPVVPIAFDQGPEWGLYWRLVRLGTNDAYAGRHVSGFRGTWAEDCANALLLEALGLESESSAFLRMC